MEVFLILVSIVLFAVAIYSFKLRNRFEGKLSNIKDFTASQQYISTDYAVGISVDEQKKKVAIFTNTLLRIGAEPIIFTYKDILSSEILEDGSTITETSRTSQAGGALLGGILLGPLGAVVGGLSGKAVSTSQINSIDLVITVNDTSNPIYTINFLDNKVKKDSMVYNYAITQARRWHSIINLLIKKANEEDNKKAQITEVTNVVVSGLNKVENKPTTGVSLSQELANFRKLKEDGVLSDEEYKIAKMKVLSNDYT